MMADGSVQFVKNSVALNIWVGLGTRANGEVISADALMALTPERPNFSPAGAAASCPRADRVFFLSVLAHHHRPGMSVSRLRSPGRGVPKIPAQPPAGLVLRRFCNSLQLVPTLRVGMPSVDALRRLLEPSRENWHAVAPSPHQRACRKRPTISSRIRHDGSSNPSASETCGPCLIGDRRRRRRGASPTAFPRGAWERVGSGRCSEPRHFRQYQAPGKRGKIAQHQNAPARALAVALLESTHPSLRASAPMTHRPGISVSRCRSPGRRHPGSPSPTRRRAWPWPSNRRILAVRSGLHHCGSIVVVMGEDSRFFGDGGDG